MTRLSTSRRRGDVAPVPNKDPRAVPSEDRTSTPVSAPFPPSSGRLDPRGPFDWPAESSPVALLRGPDIAAPLPELDYLVRAIALVAGAGAPHLIAGYGFSGKTLAVQSLALSLAAGTLVWGAHPSKPRRVTHLDLEQGDRVTRERYQRLAIALGVDLTSLGDGLVVAIQPRVRLQGTCEKVLYDLMRDRDLLIVDSLSAATPGLDENARDIRAPLDLLTTLSERTGCRALVLHHFRKPNFDGPGGARHAIRGSSAIFDAVDSAYGFGGKSGGPILVEHLKARSHGELLTSFTLRVSDVGRAGDSKAGLQVQWEPATFNVLEAANRGADVASARCNQRLESDATRIRQTLSNKPGLGTAALRAATGMSGTRLRAALDHLGDAIEVRLEPHGRARKVCHFVRTTSKA
ncbi:MAG TPA: AAA family ATPase [Polyangiaceae bacterium]|jgi:hypothetical protein|nr:AAA family ATPase [Polyangiaceae bacterium]